MSSSSSCSSSSESETSPPPMSRTVQRTFVFLRHKVKSIPKGNLENELKKSGRIRDVSFSPKLNKQQLGDLLASCMPCLAQVPLDQLQVYKSTSRGSQVVKVADSLPDAKELLSLMQGTKSKKILLYYKKSSKSQRQHSKADAEEKKQKDFSKEPAKSPESSNERKRIKGNVGDKHNVDAMSSNIEKRKKRNTEKNNEEEKNVMDDPDSQDDGAGDAAGTSLQQHTTSVIYARHYEGNGIIVGKLCKNEVKEATAIFKALPICQEKLVSYDSLLSKGLQTLESSPQDVSLDEEVVFGANASLNANANDSTLVIDVPDDENTEEKRDDERKKTVQKPSEAALERKKRRRARRREKEKTRLEKKIKLD